MTETGPVPPQNLDAEESVLGAMMLAPQACDDVVSILEPLMFYRESHGALFAVARELHAQGNPVDVITLTSELDSRGFLEQVGGGAKVKELAALVPATRNVAHYARIVREAWAKREVIKAGGSISQMGWNGMDSFKAVQQATELLRTLNEAQAEGELDIAGAALADELQAKWLHPPDENEGIATPFNFLRRMLGGRLYVLGGYQGDGKTSLSLQFIRKAIEDESATDEPVGFFSIEMSRHDLMDRMVSSFGVPYHVAQSPRLATPEQSKIAYEATKTMADWNWTVIDDPGINVAEIASKVRKYGFRYIVIDHLHRLDWEERRDLERSIRAITNIARDFNIPVLLLAQLRRNPAGHTPFPRPTMSSLRETGMLEAEAAMVWFVWRKRDEHNLATEESEFITAKNRFGKVGFESLSFNERLIRFEEV